MSHPQSALVAKNNIATLVASATTAAISPLKRYTMVYATGAAVATLAAGSVDGQAVSILLASNGTSFTLTVSKLVKPSTGVSTASNVIVWTTLCGGLNLVWSGNLATWCVESASAVSSGL